MAASRPAAVAGMLIDERDGAAPGSSRSAARSRARGTLRVIAPTWRPDLSDPADLVEEVVRLEGYDKIPSELPDCRRPGAG